MFMRDTIQPITGIYNALLGIHSFSLSISKDRAIWGPGLGWGRNLNLERGSESLLSPCAQFRVGEMSLSSDEE